MTAKRFRSRPSTVLAVRWDGTYDSRDQIKEFVPENRIAWALTPSGRLSLELVAGVNGAQGWVFVPIGEWVVRPVDSDEDFWPVEDAYFRAKYEEDG